MSEKSDRADAAIEEAQTQLRVSLDNAKKLVERTKSLLSREPESDAA